MMRKKLEWLKRGICLTLAGTLILCSDSVSYAAVSATEIVSETEAAESADTMEKNTESTEATSEGNTGTEGASAGTENSGGVEKQDSTGTETSAGEEDFSDIGTEDSAAGNAEASSEAEAETTETSTEAETETTETSTEAETETTETEKSEDATEETETEGEKVPNGITLNVQSKYTEISIGEEIALPEYTIQYADPSAAGSEAQAEWSTDGLGIVSLDAANGKVKGEKAGVTALKLQVKNTDIYAEYFIAVAPSAPGSATLVGTTYNSVELSWGAVTDAAGYTVYRKAENETEFAELAHVEGGNATTYKDSSSVVTGTKYTYRVKAFIRYQDETGTEKYAESENFAQITAAPALGKVTAAEAVANAYNSVLVSWNALEGAEGYVVYRTAGAAGSYVELGSVEAGVLSYTDNSVAAGNTYSYKISAYRTVNGSRVYGEYSDACTAQPELSATTLKAEVKGPKSVKLTWEKVNGASGYAIYRKVSGQEEFKQIKTVEGGSKTSYTDKSVKTGTKYAYVVRAYSSANGGKVLAENSNQVTVTPTIPAPSEVTVTNTSYNSVTIKWSKVKGAEGYKILRANSLNGSYKTVATVKASEKRSYVNKKLAVGKTYYYKVCAYTTSSGKKLNGVRSEAVSAKAVPTATTVKSEAAGATAVKLTWEKVTLPSQNSGYIVYRVENGQSKKVKTCKSKATSYTVKNLTPGVNYTFKVVPYVKKSGKNVLGLDSNLLTTTPKLLSVTIDKAQSAANGSIKLTWKATADAGEDTYVIYRSTSKKSGYSSIGSVVRQNGVGEYSFEDGNVAFGKKYYYKIMCTRTLADGTLMKSAYSEVMTVTSAPGAPSLTISESGSESLKLTWEKVKISSGKYVDGYAIYRCGTENGTYKKIKTIKSGSTTSYTDEGLTTGNTYYYKIRAYYKSGGKTIYSAFSDIVSKQVVPSAPAIEAVSADYQTVRISWKQIKGASGYQVKRADAAEGAYKTVKNITSGSTLTYDDSKLTTGKTYYYKVRAYVKKDGKKIYGAYSDVKYAVPVLGKPTDLAGAAIDDNQIKLTWKAVPGANTYTIVRSSSADGTYKIASEICNTNSFIDSSVTVGKTYYYKVQAIRDSIMSDFTDPVAVTAASLELSTTSVTMKTGTNMKLTATPKPTAYVAWSSDNPQIAVVTSDGVVYALKAGTTTINATANNMTKKVTVTVKDTLGTENKGIEISADNGTVNFNSLRSAGYEYVMLRISSGTTEDKNFKTNLKNAKAAGLKVGVYCVSKAQTKTAAVNEAKKVISILNGEALDYPVVYDLEDMSLLYNNVTKTERVEFVKAFQSEITGAGKGYKFILGISMKLLTEYPAKYLDTSLLAGMDLWIYNCRAENLGHGYMGTGNVVMWRYSEEATVNGVSGKVSISNRYKTY